MSSQLAPCPRSRDALQLCVTTSVLLAVDPHSSAMADDKVARRRRAEQKRRMVNKYPAAAALLGYRPLQREDVAITSTFHRWLLAQRRLAQEMEQHYNTYPELGARIEMTGPDPCLMLSAHELADELAEATPLSTSSEVADAELPVDVWGLIVAAAARGSLECWMSLGQLLRCSGELRDVVRSRRWGTFRQLPPSARRRFVVKLLGGAVIEIPFAHTGNCHQPCPPLTHTHRPHHSPLACLLEDLRGRCNWAVCLATTH